MSDVLDELCARIMGAAPRLGRTRLVLIDGHSGSGKTTLSYALAGAVPAEIVHTDDLLDGWADQFTYWERLETLVLDPIAVGEPGWYRPFDWVTMQRAEEWMSVPAGDVLIVEGVGAARERGRKLASLSVFVDAPAELRRARSLARDGWEMQEPLHIWRHREELHFGADATRWCVDVVIGSNA